MAKKKVKKITKKTPAKKRKRKYVKKDKYWKLTPKGRGAFKARKAAARKAARAKARKAKRK